LQNLEVSLSPARKLKRLPVQEAPQRLARGVLGLSGHPGIYEGKQEVVFPPFTASPLAST
jgi:hypothetical protein